LLESCDALRRPERFDQILLACEADYRGRLGWEARPYPQAAAWRKALDTVRAVPAGEIASTATSSAQIANRIREARIAALKEQHA
jgi:tRNA nucleotidyltransferase (CCA-adding enzyme)